MTTNSQFINTANNNMLQMDVMVYTVLSSVPPNEWYLIVCGVGAIRENNKVLIICFIDDTLILNKLPLIFHNNN
jgi:hypothetical protein